MGKKLFNVFLVILVTFLCPLSTIVAIAAGSIFTTPVEELADVKFWAPGIVVVGEPFTVEFSVTNTTAAVQVLDDIDLNPDALDAMELVRATPAFYRSNRDPFFQTYWYDLEIQPGSTLDVTWEMVAIEAGSHSLRFGVCINSPASCVNFETVVVAR
jgi:hypothetical protein